MARVRIAADGLVLAPTCSIRRGRFRTHVFLALAFCRTLSYKDVLSAWFAGRATANFFWEIRFGTI